MTRDFNKTGDDVKAISEAKLAKMDRLQRFEKLFPFYRMDVNGYSLRIREAREFQGKLDNKPMNKVEDVSLIALQAAFKTHNSWSDL